MKRKVEENVAEEGRANGDGDSGLLRAVLHYLGPPGTYSHQVALGVRDRLLQGATTPIADRMAAEVILQPCATITATVEEADKAFKKGQIGLALLPYENNTNGPVTDSFDLVHDADKHAIHLIADAFLPVSHSLLVNRDTATALLKGKPEFRVTDLRRLDSVSSHIQALGQCSRYLDLHLRSDAPRIQTASTGEAARSLHEKGKGLHAAIASRVCTRDDVYGLVEVYPDIQNSKGNTTRFLICQIDTKKLANTKSTLQLAPIGEASDGRAKAMFVLEESQPSVDLSWCLSTIARIRHEREDGTEDGTVLFTTKIDRKSRMPNDQESSSEGPWCSSYVIEVEAMAMSTQASLDCLNEVRTEIGRQLTTKSKFRWLGAWLA